MKQSALKIILIILAFVLLMSCRKNVELSIEDQKLLLYSLGEEFSLVRNNTDTFNFKVTDKTVSFIKSYRGFYDSDIWYQAADLKYTCNGKYSNISVTSNTSSGSDDYSSYYEHWFSAEEEIFFGNFESLLINIPNYKNCLLLTSWENDSMFFTKEQGIILVKTKDNHTYRKID